MPSALVESNQGCKKQKIQQPEPLGLNSLEQQCGISWDILHCRSSATAGVVQQQGEGCSLSHVRSSKSLVMSMSHHRDNKDVWWDRTMAVWTMALLRLLFCFCSSLLRSLGYTTLGMRSIWQCCSSLPDAAPEVSMHLASPCCPYEPLLGPWPSLCLCAERKCSADISFQIFVHSNWLRCF